MHTKTISISGTYLVPIDPSLLKQCPLGGEVDVLAEKDVLVIRPVRHQPRRGWAEALAQVPTEVIEPDDAELAAFRETPHEVGAERETHCLLAGGLGDSRPRGTFEIIALPDTWPNIVGQIPLEHLDWVVAPRHRRLIPNPEHKREELADAL